MDNNKILKILWALRNSDEDYFIDNGLQLLNGNREDLILRKIRRVQGAVSLVYGLDQRRLKSKLKTRELAEPRQMIWLIVKEQNDWIPYKDIGKYYRRGHADTWLGVDKIKQIIETNKVIREKYELIKQKLEL